MYNTYISSSLFSLRTNGSPSISFNDCSNLLNERFERNPLSSSRYCGGSGCCCCSCSCSFSWCGSCCSCCGSSYPNCRVHTNPNLFYGLRPSRLIRHMPSRRLILSGRERDSFQFPSYGIDNCDYEVSCSFKERSDLGGGVEMPGKGKLGGGGLRGRRWFSRVDDVDAVISLLCEEVSRERLDNGGRNRSSFNSVEVREVKKREGYGGGFHRERKNDVRLELLDSNSEDESVSVELRKEGCGRREEKGKKEAKEESKRYRREEKEEQKAALGSAYRTGRKESSSSPYYYPVSSSAKFESNKETQEVHGDFREESYSGRRKESSSGVGRFQGNVEEEIRSCRERIGADKDALEWKSSATRTGVEWDLSKKTEKKFTASEETQYREEHVQLHSRMLRSHESDKSKASSSYNKIEEGEENLSKVNSMEGTRTRYSQVGENLEEQQSDIRRNYQQVTDVQEIYHKNGTVTSQSQKQGFGKGGSLSLEENLGLGRTDESYRMDSERGHLSSRPPNLAENTEIENLDGERMSHRHRWSESRMKLQEEDRALMPSWERNEQHYKAAELVSGQTETRSSGNFSTVTDANDSHSKRTSISSSGIAISDSGSQSKAQKSSRDQRNYKMIQLSKDSEDVTNVSVNVTNVSVVCGGHAETVKGSQRSTETRRNQANDFSSIVKPIEQGRETDCGIESSMRFQLTNEGRRDVSGSGFFERSAKRAIVTESSLNIVSQQEMDIEHEGERDRQPTLVAPYGGRTPASSKEPDGMNWQVDSHRKASNLPSPKDALGSAQRLEEASAQFVAEYLEQTKHEASTSKILEEKTLADTKLELESGKRRQISEGIKLKKRDSRRSSRGSGVKGDEMKDTRNTSLEQSQETQELDGVAAKENIAARRTGKSLWNMIANIVTLGWHLHSKSGQKSSSNDSVRSEAWLSGNEPDEKGNENLKERRSSPHEASSSDHMRRKQSPVKGKGEAADSMRQLEADSSSSSVGLESRSTSSGFLSPSEGKNLSQDEESGVVQVHPSIVTSGSILEEGGVKGEIATTANGSQTQMKQPLALNLTDKRLGSKGNEGELKQKRFQQSPQVPRHRFDAWEEAYILEKEQLKVDEFFMKQALVKSKNAADMWEVPVGAVLVQHGKIIARGYNLVEESRDSTAHAELVCIREASKQLRSWRLPETTLYVTLEPCPMCAGAILQARIDALVWGAPNKLLGADGSWIRLFPDDGKGGTSSEPTPKPAGPVHPLHPNITVRRGILSAECAEVMQQFFQLRRRKKKKDDDQAHQPPSRPIANHQSNFLTKLHHKFSALHVR